jgi:hypothetical protein
MLGSTKGFFVCINDKLVAVTKGNTLTQVQVPAGKVAIMVRSQNWEILSGQVVAGKTYHVLTSVSPGVTRALVRLELIAPGDERIAKASNIRVVTPSRDKLKRYTDKYDPQAATMYAIPSRQGQVPGIQRQPRILSRPT